MRSDGQNDVLLSFSTDGGVTWKGPKRVNQDLPTSGLDHFDESVAANGGVVHVAYLIRSNGSQRLKEQYTVSMDGGRTFSAETTLGPRLDIQYAAEVFFTGTKFLGDYFAMAAGPGVAHAVWVRPSKPA